MAGPDPAGADLPEAASRRLRQDAFSSGLSVADFAACLQMGMRPVGLVQGFCAMRWSWYGAGSTYLRSGYGPSGWGSAISTYRCPHGFVSADHRSWGENFEQPWVTSAWAEGFNSAYTRMIEEAQDAGAHGVVGVIDRISQLVGSGVREFHLLGTAVAVEGGGAPPAIWTTYLAGQRLAKLFEAGYAPISVVAAMSSVRIWEACTTEILVRGGWDQWGAVTPGGEIAQISDAHMSARRLARDHLRQALGHDALHGASMDVSGREIAEGDAEITCTLRGTRVRRVGEPLSLPVPLPTVRLS